MSKLVAIVGGSRGIGLELVRQFAALEHQVMVFSRSEHEDFQKLSNVTYHRLDLESKSVRNDLEKRLKEFPNVDVLINNAGLLVNKPFLELTQEDLERSYQVNLHGVIATTQAFVPKMEQSGGHIVNISSVGGFQGSVKFPGLTAYSTSKAALCSFTELFSEEYKDSKIAMNCLCLGAVQTEMLAAAFPGYEAPTTPEQMASFIVDFALNQHQFFRGKILPVSISTP